MQRAHRIIRFAAPIFCGIACWKHSPNYFFVIPAGLHLRSIACMAGFFDRATAHFIRERMPSDNVLVKQSGRHKAGRFGLRTGVEETSVLAIPNAGA